MRKLMWFTIGFGLSCGYCAYFAPESIVFGLCLLAACGIFLGCYSRKLTPAELICFGAVLGLCWFSVFDQYVLAPARAHDGKETDCTIVVSDYSWDSDYGITADGRITLQDREYAIRFYLNEQTRLTPGDTVTGTFRLRYTPGGEERATFHSGYGIYLLGYPRGDISVTAGEGGREYLGAEMAHWIKIRLKLLVPQDIFAFSQALLLGDSSELDYETDTAFKLSGIRHIVAVSGLHVMLLYSLFSTLSLKNKWLIAIFCLPVLGIFAAAAGFTPSVTRASIMAAMMILANLCNREYDPPSALSFSVLVMVCVNPLVMTSAGFQLTVGCAAGIQLCASPLGDWMKARWKRFSWLASSTSVTLGAMSLTTPLSAIYFGSVSLVGVAANLLTVWIVNWIFLGLVFLILLSLVSLRWAAFLGGLLAWPVRLVLGIAKRLSGLPLAAVYTDSPYIVAWLIFVYILILVSLSQFRKRTGLLLGCAAVGLCAALTLSFAEPRLDTCRLTMLDVGQGQCLLLQSGGENYLIDCGGEHEAETADIAAQHLLSQGITRLDGVILTHWDEDHAGGLPLLLTRIGTECLYAPEPDTADMAGIWVDNPVALAVGEGKMTIFPGEYGENTNENSLCVLFESENCVILITGDRSGLGELLLLAEYDLPQVDLLIAGHHGSKYSTSEALLEAVQPEVVFISAGADNAYGHPAPELLARLQQFGCRVYRTDLSGTLIFRR